MARILVIEDNAASTKLTTFVLQHAGYTALCAVDAETGLTLARTARPDLILVDILLPGIDGLAATALLKADPITAAIPIIALTSLWTKDDETKALLVGCDAYIAKPFVPQQLRGAIEDLLLKRRPPSAPAESRH